jgi:hypothetical protein
MTPAQLDEVWESLDLPEEATATRALEDFVVRLRLETARLGTAG